MTARRAGAGRGAPAGSSAGTRTRPVTITDVARTAGVSVATASKALNGRADVGAMTRERVRQVASAMAFRPNAIARSLLSGRTGSVGLLTSDGEGRFAVPVMVGAEDALGSSESVAVLSITRGRPDLEVRHLQALLSRRVDGLVVVGHTPEERSPVATTAEVPTVYAYAPSSGPGDTSFVPDHRGGARLAAEHLVETGKTRIAHLGGPVTGVGATAARLRAAGTLDGLRTAGLSPVTGAALHGDWLEQWGWEATDTLLETHPDVDGLVCGNDQIARGAIDLLAQRGRSVPDDVAVIGFDDWTQFTDLGRLPQSSVDMQLHELGGTCARAVLDPRSVVPGQHLLPCRLVARASTLSSSRGVR